MANEMRDRLKENISIIKKHNDTGASVLNITCGNKIECEVIDEIVEDVSSIIEKMEKETLIELPCKIGSSVYVFLENKFIQELEVVLITIYDDGYFISASCKQSYECCEDLCDDNKICGRHFSCKDIGKTVFLTKAEAEQKLKEMRGE